MPNKHSNKKLHSEETVECFWGIYEYVAKTWVYLVFYLKKSLLQSKAKPIFFVMLKINLG